MSTKHARQSSVYEYFVFVEEQNKYFCVVKHTDGNNEKLCNATVTNPKGNPCGNLKRHLARFHPQVHAMVIEADEGSSTVSKKIRCEKGQMSISSFVKRAPAVSATVTISKQAFLEGLLKMLVYDSVPLTFFESEGFKMLNGSMAERLNVPLGRDAIRAFLMKRVDQEKANLKAELKGKLLFLKFDHATRLRMHFMGVNVQYNGNDGVKIKTLALSDTSAKHDSASIKDSVEKVLADFEIKREQVMAAVVDNAANMTKTVALLNDEDNEEDDGDATDEDGNDDDEEAPTARMNFVHHMRCAAHTLQLGVRDGLRRQQVAAIVTKVSAYLHSISRI